MNNSNEIKILESVSREYLEPDDGRMVDKKVISMVIDNITPWLKGPEILEMGFGDDLWTSRIIDKYGHSSIVDASQILLNEAKKKYGTKIKAYHCLFEEFIPDKKYDTVVASFVLEHVKDPVEILINTKKWINKEGHVIIIVPNADSLHRRLAVCIGLQKRTDELSSTDMRVGHRRVYNIAKMVSDINLAGLKVFRKRGLFLKFLPQNMMTQLSDELLVGFMKLSENIPMEYCSRMIFDCVL